MKTTLREARIEALQSCLGWRANDRTNAAA